MPSAGRGARPRASVLEFYSAVVAVVFLPARSGVSVVGSWGVYSEDWTLAKLTSYRVTVPSVAGPCVREAISERCRGR